MIRIVPADDALLQRFYATPPPVKVEAVAAVEDGAPLGVVGVWRAHEHGVQVMFSDGLGSLNKRTLSNLCWSAMELAWQSDMPIFAQEDSVEGADVLLRHLGFEPATEGIWRWAK